METELQPDETIEDSETSTDADDIATDPAQDGQQTPDQAEPSDKEDVEDEIVLADEGDSQTPKKKKKRSYSHRIQAKNNKIAESNGRAEKAEQENAVLRQALDAVRGNQTPAVVQPDANDLNKFPDGVHDQAYIREFNDFIIKSNQQGFQQQIQEAQKQSSSFQNQRTQEDAFYKADLSHYDRASDLKVSDFEEMEDKGIGLVGQDIFNQIKRNFSNSEKVIYLLGKNPDEALRIKRLADSGDAFKCVAELGKISAKAQVKTKSAIPADPESKIAGGSPPVSTNNLQKEFDNAIDSDNFARAREIEAQADKRGVKIKKV